MALVKPKAIDSSLRGEYHYLSEADLCFFLLEYTAGAGYDFSSTNRLIFNLKKKMDRRGRPEWRYKGEAIRRAAKILESMGSDWLDVLGEMVFVPIPPSAAKGDPLHDDRLIQILRRVSAHHRLDIRELVYQEESTRSSSRSGSARLKPQDLRAVYRIDESQTEPPPKSVLLFDDLLTTGNHFMVAKGLILKRFPMLPITGLFLARSLHAASD